MKSFDSIETIEKRYQAWVNNKVKALAWLIARNQRRSALSLMKHEFFLNEIEHHFMDTQAQARVWRAFAYLKLYLRNYPYEKTSHSKYALQMLCLIYEHLGFDSAKICNLEQDNSGTKRLKSNENKFTFLLRGESHAAQKIIR